MVRKVKVDKKKYTLKFGIFLIVISLVLPVIKTTRDTLHIKVKAKEINAYLVKTAMVNQYKNPSNKYQAIIEIPDINLQELLLPNDSKYNDVKYGIQVLSNTTPDIKNSNLILASHSGTSKVAYFNDLDKLSIGSMIIIYYKGFKYIYTLDNSYSVWKNGYADIIRDKYRNTITLITCSKNNNEEQIIYIGYLVTKITY